MSGPSNSINLSFDRRIEFPMDLSIDQIMKQSMNQKVKQLDEETIERNKIIEDLKEIILMKMDDVDLSQDINLDIHKLNSLTITDRKRTIQDIIEQFHEFQYMSRIIVSEYVKSQQLLKFYESQQ